MTNDLKGYQRWQEQINVAMREPNDNIDHKNMVITWISFANEVKSFLNSIYKRRRRSNIFDNRPNLDHIFGPKKDKVFCPVFVFRSGMSNVICVLILYLQSEGLNISWI